MTIKKIKIELNKKENIQKYKTVIFTTVHPHWMVKNMPYS